MKKLILISAIGISVFLSGFKASAQQTLGVFKILQNQVCVKDSASPVIPADSAYIAKLTPNTYISLKVDSLTYILKGSGTTNRLTDSLIVPIQFQNNGANGIMDFGVRTDTAGFDSIMVYQNNVKIFTANSKIPNSWNNYGGYTGRFKTGDIFFPFVSNSPNSQFITANKFVIKPCIHHSTANGSARKAYVNLNYYQQ